MENTSKTTILIGYILFIMAGFVLLLMTTRSESFLLLNGCHTPFLDVLMRNWTHLGNGLTALGFSILMGFKKIRYFFYFLITYAVSGLLVQFLKRHIFDDMVRPLKYFTDLGQEIALVPGVKVYQYNTFPSGHTATAFALFVGIALMVKNKTVKIICLLLAIGVAYSRVYLAQHFPADVLAGSFIGVIIAWGFYIVVSRWKAAWLDRPFVNLTKK